jgi:uncharacterized protein YjiS (DUF1127 family)
MLTIDVATRPQSSAPAVKANVLRSIAGAAARALWGMLDILLTWQDNARQRHELLALDDYMLKDIGISRAQADLEGSKPFWRD